MWPVTMWHLAVCGSVTLVALLIGFMYTYVRQRGMKYLSSFRVTEEQTDKWPSDHTNLGQLDGDQVRSDSVKFCSHIPGHIKQTKHRITQQKIEATMTPEERNKEREIQRRQLEEIFRVMEEQKDKFGVNDFADVQEQMKMYIQ